MATSESIVLHCAVPQVMSTTTPRFSSRNATPWISELVLGSFSVERNDWSAISAVSGSVMWIPNNHLMK